MQETHERMDTIARKHNNWVNRQMRENSAAKSTTDWLQEIAMETASECGMYRDVQVLLKQEILDLQQDLARARETSRTFEMETHELRQRLVDSQRENQKVKQLLRHSPSTSCWASLTFVMTLHSCVTRWVASATACESTTVIWKRIISR